MQVSKSAYKAKVNVVEDFTIEHEFKDKNIEIAFFTYKE